MIEGEGCRNVQVEGEEGFKSRDTLTDNPSYASARHKYRTSQCRGGLSRPRCSAWGKEERQCIQHGMDNNATRCYLHSSTL